MNYCTKHSELCEFANAFGYCSVTACTKSVAWSNTHLPNIIYNFPTEPKRDDGIYMELFAVKNGVRYNAKVVNMKDMSTIFTSSLMDGIEKLWK